MSTAEHVDSPLSSEQLETIVRLCQQFFGTKPSRPPTTDEVYALLNDVRRLQFFQVLEANPDAKPYVHLVPRE